MLKFVQKTCGSILADEHHAFIARFGGLSRDARCLLIRMVNRRGAIFNRSLFSYPEITDVELAAAELTADRTRPRCWGRRLPGVRRLLPKNVLLTGAQAAGRGDVLSRGPSPSLSTTIWSRSPSRSRRNTAEVTSSSRVMERGDCLVARTVLRSVTVRSEWRHQSQHGAIHLPRRRMLECKIASGWISRGLQPTSAHLMQAPN